MRVFDAKVKTVSPDGMKCVLPIADFQQMPGSMRIGTSLLSGEMITAAALPPPLPGRCNCQKVRDRAWCAFAMVLVAAIINGTGGYMGGARLASGGLTHGPWRVLEAESALRGVPANDANANANCVLAGARGFGHNDFGIPLVRRTLRAVLTQAHSHPYGHDCTRPRNAKGRTSVA